MRSQTSQFAVKLLPSLTDFAFLMPIAFLFGRMDGTKTLLSDCDTGWHIRTGEWIVSNHQVPVRDVFSFSKAGQPWFAWEWLADVIYAWFNSHGGLATVVLASVLLLSITFTLLFRLALRKANPIIAILITMLAAAASALHWLARPHLFSLLFLVLFYIALENVRAGRTRWHGIPYLAMLPPATILWTNLHGAFFVGIVLLAAYGAGEILNVLVDSDRTKSHKRLQSARLYFVTALACLAASLVNPYFYQLHVHIFQYLRDPFQAEHIVEFLSISFRHPLAIFLELLLVLGAGAAIWHAARGSYTEAILLLVWGHGALLSARNIPLFGIIAAPIIASAVDAWDERMPNLNVAEWLRTAARKFAAIAAETAATDAIARWHLASVAGIALVAALLYAPAPPKRFRSEYDPKSYPAAAIKVLQDDSEARIFTNDEWGDYLIYRLYPRNRVFVDGRSDFYGDDFEQKYIDVLNVQYGWEATLSRFGINTILLPPNAPLTGALKESSRWRVVYDDGIALVFRSTPKTGGTTVSATLPGGGKGRDRKLMSNRASEQAIADSKSKA